MKSVLDLSSRDAIESWLRSWMASELGIERSEIDAHKPFLGYGMNSLQAMMLIGDLESVLNIPLPPTLAWDHPTLNALARHLGTVLAAREPATAACDGPPPAPPVALDPGSAEIRPGEAEALLAQLDRLTEEEIDSLLQRYLP